LLIGSPSLTRWPTGGNQSDYWACKKGGRIKAATASFSRENPDVVDTITPNVVEASPARMVCSVIMPSDRHIEIEDNPGRGESVSMPFPPGNETARVRCGL
jgi:hypothetical protein